MKKTTALALVLFGISSMPLFGLDLRPHSIVLSSDGPPMQRYFFEDGGKRLSFRIDRQMEVRGSSDAADFEFDDLKNATMKISRSQRSPAIPFDQKNIESYRAAARTLLRPEATNIQLEEERPGAISINGWISHQFIFTYTLFGADYRRSITFLNYSETEQFIVDVTAGSDDYEKAYARGYRVLNSLTDLPVDNKGPT